MKGAGGKDGTANKLTIGDDGLIRRAGTSRLYVPTNEQIRSKILHECHDAPLAGHIGVAKTRELVSRYFYWKGMNRDIETYVVSCPSCQMNKPSNQKPMGKLMPIAVPGRRCEVWTMDAVMPLRVTKRGNSAMWVFVEKLSKLVHIAATKHTITAPELAEVFMREVVRHHGVPKSIISDRGSVFPPTSGVRCGRSWVHGCQCRRRITHSRMDRQNG